MNPPLDSYFKENLGDSSPLGNSFGSPYSSYRVISGSSIDDEIIRSLIYEALRKNYVRDYFSSKNLARHVKVFGMSGIPIGGNYLFQRLGGVDYLNKLLRKARLSWLGRFAKFSGRGYLGLLALLLGLNFRRDYNKYKIMKVKEYVLKKLRSR